MRVGRLKRRKSVVAGRSQATGGNGPFMSPLPTKLLMNWEDITTDHGDVPAFVKIPWRLNCVLVSFRGFPVFQSLIHRLPGGGRRK